MDAQFTTLYGSTHPYTAHLRDLRGWIAQLLGAPDVATQWFLHTTGLRCTAYGTTHHVTATSADRTIRAWSTITNQDQARTLAQDVLAMLAYLDTDHSATLAQQVVEHLSGVPSRWAPITSRRQDSAVDQQHRTIGS